MSVNAVVTFNVNGSIIDEYEFERRLLRSDLTTIKMNGLQLFFWSIIRAIGPCFVRSAYERNLAATHQLFNVLNANDPRFVGRPRLLIAYQRAQNQFWNVYPQPSLVAFSAPRPNHFAPVYNPAPVFHQPLPAYSHNPYGHGVAPQFTAIASQQRGPVSLPQVSMMRPAVQPAVTTFTGHVMPGAGHAVPQSRPAMQPSFLPVSNVQHAANPVLARSPAPLVMAQPPMAMSRNVIPGGGHAATNIMPGSRRGR